MPHRILSEEEKTKIFELYKISSPEPLPAIDSQDTMVKWIGAIPGDIIEVTRHSDTAGRSLYYRHCVEDVNAALVVRHPCTVFETWGDHGDVHADDCKRIHPVRKPFFAMGLGVVMGNPKLLNLSHSHCSAVVVIRECPKA